MYNVYLFNQLVTSVRNRSLMQNVMQEMAQFSSVKHFKNSGWETKKFVYRNFILEKWLALFQKILHCVLRWVEPTEWSQCSQWNRYSWGYVEGTCVIHESPSFPESVLAIWNCTCTVRKTSCSEIHVLSYNFVMLTLTRVIFLQAWLPLVF